MTLRAQHCIHRLLLPPCVVDFCPLLDHCLAVIHWLIRDVGDASPLEASLLVVLLNFVPFLTIRRIAQVVLAQVVLAQVILTQETLAQEILKNNEVSLIHPTLLRESLTSRYSTDAVNALKVSSHFGSSAARSCNRPSRLRILEADMVLFLVSFLRFSPGAQIFFWMSVMVSRAVN